MKEFIFGFITGIAFLIIVFPFVSRWLMKFFIKREMNSLANSVTGNLMNLTNEFGNMQNEGKKINQTGTGVAESRDLGSEGATNDTPKRDNRRRKGSKVPIDNDGGSSN